jgi:hypothetical protein
MTAVPPDIIDAERDGPAFRFAGEVMLIHLERFSAPSPSLVPEVADQLFLLGIDADDGQPGRSERRPLSGDVPELRVAFGMLRPPSSFLVTLERETHFLKELADGAVVRSIALPSKGIPQPP